MVLQIHYVNEMDGVMVAIGCHCASALGLWYQAIVVVVQAPAVALPQPKKP